MEMLLIMAVFIGLMYVLMILPQKRKMDAQKKLLNELEPGSRVMLNTGMFGTIRATGNQQMVVELAPGVEVTVLKQAVMRAVTAAEEEFEYDDGEQTTADQFVSEDPTADGVDFAPGPEWRNDPNTAELADQGASVETEDPLAKYLDRPTEDAADEDRPQAR